MRLMDQSNGIGVRQVQSQDLLLVRTANQCIQDAKARPVPKMLFSEFWNEGELCILFSDTNLGKSILAVQIANSITQGEPIPGFTLGAKPQSVLYFDFEMSDKQFQNRYSDNYSNEYMFHSDFLRIEINPECTDFNQFELQLIRSIESAIEQYNSRILIVDNLTYLKTQTTETAKEALPLMKSLKSLKLKYGLSILALAHTPKRNPFNPITINDLAGSKQLANFADSVFTIGESHKDKSLRYFKQLKARATEVMYDAQNVIICEVSKPSNFLGFEFLEFGSEKDHLKETTDKEQYAFDKEIIELKESEANISNAEIARRLFTNKMKVGRVLHRWENSNGVTG